MRALICPVMLHDKTVFYSPLSISRVDKSLSFGLAVLIHIAVFAAAGALFVKPPQFGVNHGIGSIEVNLVAAPTESVPQVKLIQPPVPVKTEFATKKIVPKPVVKKIEKVMPSKTKGKNKVTMQSTGGAISEAKPDYLKNPAPEYPELARKRGYQGTVFIRADIDRNGIPVNVSVEKSSGHSILDEAALKAVKGWKFSPGKIGNLPIESVVRVPVKFYLNEN